MSTLNNIGWYVSSNIFNNKRFGTWKKDACARNLSKQFLKYL